MDKRSTAETRGKPDASSFWKWETVTPVLILAVALSASLFLWAGNIAFRLVKPEQNVIPPTRWLASVIIPLAFMFWGRKRKSLSKSGALVGLFMGFTLTLSSYCFLACLMTFFVSSSKITKFRAHEKRKIEHDFKEGGQRNWLQAVCNGGVACQLSILYIIEIGVGEYPIDFNDHFRATWLSLGILGAFACANGDTWASELGTVLSKSNPRLITSGRKVPRGVNGGVSIVGLVVSTIGGAVIGLAFYLAVLCTTDAKMRSLSSPQWPVVIIGAFAGLAGSMIDSVLGATLQYSGVHKKTGVVMEQAGPDVEYVSGRRILDNHSVNLLSTLLTALLTPRMANLLWPYY